MASKISKQDALKTLGLDPYDVATKLVKVFYKAALPSTASSTPIRIREISSCSGGPEGQARIVVLDLGSATDLRGNLADGMFDILSGLMTRKDDLVVKGINEMGLRRAGR